MFDDALLTPTVRQEPDRLWQSAGQNSYIDLRDVKVRSCLATLREGSAWTKGSGAEAASRLSSQSLHIAAAAPHVAFMQTEKQPTTEQLRDDIDSGRTGSKVAAPDPAAAPLGTDDEAAGNTPSADRIEMARKAEERIGEAAQRDRRLLSAQDADEQAHSQRGSNAPYAKEDHMNNELLRRAQDPSKRQRAR